MKGKLVFNSGENLEEAKQVKSDLSNTRTSRMSSEEQAQRAAAEGVSCPKRVKPDTFKREEKKVGRNDPCPCGSGRTCKQCQER